MTLVLTAQHTRRTDMQHAPVPPAEHLVLELQPASPPAKAAKGHQTSPKVLGAMAHLEAGRLRPGRAFSLLSRSSLTLAWGFANIALLLSNR